MAIQRQLDVAADDQIRHDRPVADITRFRHRNDWDLLSVVPAKSTQQRRWILPRWRLAKVDEKEFGSATLKGHLRFVKR